MRTEFNINSFELLEQLVGAIASNIKIKSLIWYHVELEKAANHHRLLSTAEVKNLIEVKPYCFSYWHNYILFFSLPLY